MNYVKKQGFETLPVTEHSPARPIQFDKIINDENGSWANFKVENKTSSALIFNSITPYRWYEIDKEGYVCPDKPIQATFDYFINKVTNLQKEYNFDFIRADMAHNQISHAHLNPLKNENDKHEMWKLLKQNIQKESNIPYFATFGEAFLSDYYISGIKDMENKDFDSILGISNFYFLDNSFSNLIKYYIKISNEHSFCPSIVSITNDSDKKETNKFHQSPLSNEIRYFIQLLYSSLTGYTGMGFEIRNNIPQCYSEFSGCFTNYQNDKYQWGNNIELFNSISKIRKIYSKIITPDTKSVLLDTPTESTLVWLNYEGEIPRYLFLVYFDASTPKKDIKFKYPDDINLENKKLKPYFSLTENKLFIEEINANLSEIKDVNFASARIYEIIDKSNCLQNLLNLNKIFKN